MCAELSIMWTTGGAGDGASTYTMAQITDWLRRTFTGDGFAAQGVLVGYNNALAVSDHGDGTVDVATGAAVVYGFPYENSAVVNVAIPTPAASTRIDRIVLRAGWAAQTVRVTRIAGAEGGAAPALTQTPNTTYDLPLCQISITTGGVMTLTDQRGYAHFASRAATENLDDAAVTEPKVASNAITTDKIVTGAVVTGRLADDAVDDTKAGNRVPQFYRRQGGNAAIWLTSGTTDYTPTTVRMQAGVIAVTVANGVAAGSQAVTFPVAFSNIPLVFLTCWDDVGSQFPEVHISVDVVTATNCQVNVRRNGTSGDYTYKIQWFAMGPE